MVPSHKDPSGLLYRTSHLLQSVNKPKTSPTRKRKLRTTSLTTSYTLVVSLAPMSPLAIGFVGDAIKGNENFRAVKSLFLIGQLILVGEGVWMKVFHRFLIHSGGVGQLRAPKVKYCSFRRPTLKIEAFGRNTARACLCMCGILPRC